MYDFQTKVWIQAVVLIKITPMIKANFVLLFKNVPMFKDRKKESKNEHFVSYSYEASHTL